MISMIKNLPTRVKKVIIPGVSSAILFVLAAFLIVETMSVEVAVAENGEKKVVKTHADTVKELFEELGIHVDEHDVVSYDLDASLTDGMNIDVIEAKKIIVNINGEKEEYFTTFETMEQFMEEQNLKFTEHDYVSLTPDVEIEEGLRLTVKTAYQVAVEDAGEEAEVWTTGGTVEQILEDNDIELNEFDKTEPSLDEEIDNGDAITITRVEKEQEEAEERIPFQVEKKEDSSLQQGTEQVVQEGTEGKLVKTIEVTYENGEETNREVIGEEVVEESQNKVIAVGTKKPEEPKQASTSNTAKAAPKASNSTSASSSSNNSSTPSGGKEMTVEATAYTADCNGCSGISATGINLKENRNMKVIAVDPNVIPLGKKVWVEGYGTAIAGDTGGAIKGNKIDLHMPSKDAAYSFGRKSVKIKVLD